MNALDAPRRARDRAERLMAWKHAVESVMTDKDRAAPVKARYSPWHRAAHRVGRLAKKRALAALSANGSVHAPNMSAAEAEAFYLRHQRDIAPWLSLAQTPAASAAVITAFAAIISPDHPQPRAAQRAWADLTRRLRDGAPLNAPPPASPDDGMTPLRRRRPDKPPYVPGSWKRDNSRRVVVMTPASD
jgi:uncharacterized protein (DUF2252 family)